MCGYLSDFSSFPLLDVFFLRRLKIYMYARCFFSLIAFPSEPAKLGTQYEVFPCAGSSLVIDMVKDQVHLNSRFPPIFLVGFSTVLSLEFSLVRIFLIFEGIPPSLTRPPRTGLIAALLSTLFFFGCPLLSRAAAENRWSQLPFIPTPPPVSVNVISRRLFPPCGCV